MLRPLAKQIAKLVKRRCDEAVGCLEERRSGRARMSARWQKDFGPAKRLGQSVAFLIGNDAFQHGQLMCLLLSDLWLQVAYQLVDAWEEVRAGRVELLEPLQFLFDLDACIVSITTCWIRRVSCSRRGNLLGFGEREGRPLVGIFPWPEAAPALC